MVWEPKKEKVKRYPVPSICPNCLQSTLTCDDIQGYSKDFVQYRSTRCEVCGYFKDWTALSVKEIKRHRNRSKVNHWAWVISLLALLAGALLCIKYLV